ncbi:MAG: rod shape-determining protein [Patescibacteria group bacterium]|jgi:rod shape-determining protein MreB
MAFFAKKLGIDLGTTNTLIFIPRRGIVLSEPSVVAVSLHDRMVLAVGEEAKIMIGRTPETIVAYRPLKDGVIADYRTTEAMIKHFIKKALGVSHLFKPEVMISVPAGATSTEKRAVIEATLKAGAKAVYPVPESILAAIGAGIHIQQPQGHMVVDIGGGTTDIAVVSLGGIVSSTSLRVAGNKLDEAIIDYVKKEMNLAIGERTAEEVKIAAGSAFHCEEELEYEMKGQDFLSGLPRIATISTNEIAEALSDHLDNMMSTIKGVLRETPPELAADIMKTGITLTGGGALLRNIDQLVQHATGVAAHVADEPLFCVAKGTGVALEHLDIYKRTLLTKRGM